MLPFDGATGLPVGVEPRVHAADLKLPEGHALDPETVQVADLDGSGLLPGGVVFDGTDLVFEPDAPLPVDHDFAWAVLDAPDHAREPVVELPPGLAGEALFSTRHAPTPLDAAVEDGALCLLFSEDLPAVDLDLEVNGEVFPDRPWHPSWVSLAVRETPYRLHERDEIDAACLDDDLGAEPGDLVRWTAEDGTAASVVVAEGTLEDAFRARHRWVEPQP